MRRVIESAFKLFTRQQMSCAMIILVVIGSSEELDCNVVLDSQSGADLFCSPLVKDSVAMLFLIVTALS